MRSRTSCPLLLAATAALGLTAWSDPPAPDDAFLDQPLPTTLHLITEHSYETVRPMIPPVYVEYTSITDSSFLGTLDLLQELSGKKIVVSEHLREWPHDDQGWRLSLRVTKGQKVRPLFNDLCLLIGLGWKYDTASDVILLTPLWKRDDPRSAKELVHALIGPPPVPWADLPKSSTPNRTGSHSPILDDWRLAFNALLSKPENFSSGGDLRLYHDTHGIVGLSEFPTVNLFAGEMSDDDGYRRIVILNRQASTHGEFSGELACYVFDGDGRFLHGSIHTIGEVGSITRARVDGTQHLIVDAARRSDKPPTHFYFALRQEGLIYLGSTQSDGGEKNGESPHLVKIPYTDDVIYRISATPGT